MPAAAQTEELGPEPAAAELFAQGRELIKQGDWQAGCAKLELSMQRYAAASTLMNIAECRKHEGRVATAWALYRRALLLNRETQGEQRRAELHEVGRAALDALELRLPRLVVTVTPGADARVTEAGRQLPLGTSVPLDPGDYDLVASAPGHVTAERRVSLSEGETTEVAFALVAAVPPPSVPPSSVPPVAPVPEPRSDAGGEASAPLWVWLVGGAGIVMTGVAIGFAIDARLTNDALVARCGSDLVCNEDLQFDPEAENARKNRGLGLAIGFGIGGTGALTAAIVGLAGSF